MAFLVNNDNQEKFAIPNGETVIGRGPYLRVKEQSLSRSHAVISLNNGKVYIKPTHRNPTYFYSSDLVENCVSLQKDKWKELIDGDSISLLSSSYKYCIEISNVISNGSAVKSNDDKQVITEENKDDSIETSVNKPSLLDQKSTIPDINSPCVINRAETHSKDEHVSGKAMFDETLAVELSPIKEESKGFTNSACETPADGTYKKRKLPIWMMETESAGKKKKIEQKKPMEAEKQEKTTQCIPVPKGQDVCLPKVTSPINVKSTEKCISTSISEPDTKEYPAKCILKIETSPLHEACYELPVKHTSQSELPFGSQIMNKSPVDDISEDAQIVTKSPALHISQAEHIVKNNLIGDVSEETVTKPPIADILHDEQVMMKSSATEDNQSNESAIENQEDKGEEENIENKEASNSSEQNETNGKLKLCPYGKRCYRKNPAHFEEYSHSSKDDDDDENENSDGNKSECPYGLKCYRQNNPHHTNKFDHNLIGNKRAANKTRKLRKKKSKSLLDKESDNDGENQYDFDDSFLASSDDSGGYSDDSDDSDYKPPGHYDDDEDEDVDELISEAKNFIKNRKI